MEAASLPVKNKSYVFVAGAWRERVAFDEPKLTAADHIPRIELEKLAALTAEVNALDRLTPGLEVVERVVKLVADRFSVPVTAAYRIHGRSPNLTTYLDFKWGTPTRFMSVKLEDDGRYHCFHQFCADQSDRLETTTSSVAWHYVVGRPYPTVGRYNLLTP